MKGNNNCLEGMRCPKCKSHQPFRIAVTATSLVFDDGTDAFDDVDWDDESWCMCAECKYQGHVKDFKQKKGVKK